MVKLLTPLLRLYKLVYGVGSTVGFTTFKEKLFEESSQQSLPSNFIKGWTV
jgi:predicted glycosyltransferase